MELELGIKITRTSRDDTTSSSDFQFVKDRAGPIFLSKQTHATFTLTAHLKGYKKEDIEINISKDGKKISVSGEKEVQEMQMIPFKKELKMKGFKKKFKIPDKVVLDKIKAKYNEEEGVLTIVMPKMEMVKGVCGVGIEEVKEEEEKQKEEVVVNTSSVTPEEPEQSVAEEKNKEENVPLVKKQGGKRPWKPCPPLILGGGSTLLVTLIFLVIQYIRAKKS